MNKPSHNDRKAIIPSPLYKQVWLLLALLIAVFQTGNGQNNSISLEEALRIARDSYAGLERDRLSVEQQTRLSGAGLLTQPTQLFFSGEEFNFGGQSGVQSINVQQNFYLPKAHKAQRAYYQQGTRVAEKQLELTEQELERQVTQAYLRLQYAKQEQTLAVENLELYQNFLEVTTGQLESGETGRIPQLAARSRLGQAQLEREHVQEKYQIARSLFNQWLGSDSTYEVNGELPLATIPAVDTALQNNPHLQLVQARQELALAKVETQKAQLLPQINSGLRLQNAFGTFPLFGYQAGVNVPLFRKSYKTQIEAAQVAVKVEEAALRTEQQKLERTISELRYRLEHQLHILEYLEEDLSPIVNEQSEINLAAYREGEVGYLEYLDGLEQVVRVKQQYLDALYEYNALRVELDYWLGN